MKRQRSCNICEGRRGENVSAEIFKKELSIANNQNWTQKFQKRSRFVCCIPQTKYKFIRIVKNFQGIFRKSDTQAKTDSSNVWRFKYWSLENKCKTNATLGIVLGGYDLNNMSLTGFNRETNNSQTRIDIVYCSREVKVEVLKSTITDHYTVQTELDEETKETGWKMQQYYRHWAILENNSVSEKLVFQMKHKLQVFQDRFGLRLIIWKISTNYYWWNKTLCAREEIKGSQTF